MVRVPFQPDGSAGEIEIVATRLMADDFAFGLSGSAVHHDASRTLAFRLEPPAASTTLAGPEQGMVGSTACAFGKSTWRRDGDLCDDRLRLSDSPRQWHPGRQARTDGSRRIGLAPAARSVTEMSQTTQEKNKALVLEAFDTLFNKRDYEAAQRYWSPNYIQHRRISPGPGRPFRPRQEHPAHAEIRAGDYRG